MIDLPAYGQSGCDNKDRVNPKYYMDDCAEMVIKIMDIFRLEQVCAGGWCGGGANFYRTIVKYPHRFAASNIFHRVVIGEIPVGLEEVLRKYQMRFWVSWRFDVEHSPSSVGFKWLVKQS